MTTTATPALEALIPGKQWVCFDKDKKPISPVTLKGVSGQLVEGNTDWTSHEDARKIWKANSELLKGIGREFIKSQGITGIDLDDCIDEQGNIASWAQAVIDRLNSYTEISPSRRGIHVWVYGSIPHAIAPNKPNPDGYEMYDCGRYFTITGKRLPGTPDTIKDRHEEVLQLHSEIVASRKKQATQEQTAPGTDSPYGKKALDDECRNVSLAGNGSRNDQLNRSAFALGQLVGGGVLSRSTVERELYEAAMACGLAPSETVRTMRSGLDKGEQEPRTPPAKEMPVYRAEIGTASSNNGRDDLSFILECLNQAEAGDAALFAHLFRGKVIYDTTSSEWYEFKKHRWEVDACGGVKMHVSGKLASTYLQAAASINLKAKASDDDDEGTSKLKATIKALTARALTLRTAARINNVLSLTIPHDDMHITSDCWDSDIWLLPVQNGVVDLTTGRLRDGEPGDYVKTASSVKWVDIDAPAPRWENALQGIFEDREQPERDALIGFLQRALGYGTTGLVNEEIFLVLCGEEGRNGKDTIIGGVGHALGPLAGAVSNDVFLTKGKFHTAGSATPHLVALQGKRIAWASEPESGARFNASQVKDLTGGGAIPVRQVYGKQYSFDPTHLLILLTNPKPHANADDTPFWDRLRLVTFNMHFVDNPDPKKPNDRKPDKTLKHALKAEASGILAWLVRGCLGWQQQGLNAPASVLDDGKEYRKGEDNIALFIEECCVVKDELTARAGKIYEAYNTWGKSGNLYTMDSKKFGAEMAKRFSRKHDMKGGYYQGIGILNDGKDTPDDTMTGKNDYDRLNATRHAAVGPLVEPNEATAHDGYDSRNQKVPLYTRDNPGNREFTSLPVTPVMASELPFQVGQQVNTSEGSGTVKEVFPITRTVSVGFSPGLSRSYTFEKVTEVKA